MEMTKANKRIIQSLATAKGRRQHGIFVAEGTKCVLDTIGAFDATTLLATEAWLDSHRDFIAAHHIDDITAVRRADLVDISTLSTAPDVIALCRIPDPDVPRPAADTLALALDCIQDPGNIGTIVRIASWMGISDIYCSPDTVDIYNPKAVQATMGAIARVSVHYVDLPALLSDARQRGVPVYGTFLDGTNIYGAPLTPGGIIVMGNEGRGISDPVAAHIDRRLYIPPYPADAPHIDSLNVSMANAITVAEFRRRSILNSKF